MSSWNILRHLYKLTGVGICALGTWHSPNRRSKDLGTRKSLTVCRPFARGLGILRVVSQDFEVEAGYNSSFIHALYDFLFFFHIALFAMAWWRVYWRLGFIQIYDYKKIITIKDFNF